jgi:two-component system response regulator YesN
MMYKAVIVDDEKIVRVALKTMMDWEAAGFEICEAAGNAQTALKAIHRHNPDLVITDIVMPEMDGLDLIRSARTGGYDGEFIILTNHQDFNYAIEAMHNEVLDYIIKTDISPEIIGEAVQKAKDKIVMRRRSSREDRTTVDDDDDTEKIRQHLREPSQEVSFSAPLHGLYIFLPSCFNVSPNETSPGTLRNIVGEAVKELHTRLISLTPESLLIPLTMDFAADLTESGNKIIPRIQNLVQLYMNSLCGFVLSSTIETSTDLDAALERCRASAWAVLYDGYSKLIREDEASRFAKGDLKGKQTYADLTHLINEYGYEEAKEQIRTLAAHCRKRRIEAETVSHLFQAMLHLLHMDYGVWFPQGAQEPGAPRKLNTLDQYSRALESMVDAIGHNKIDFSETACRREVLRIDHHIKEHIREKITLSVLSESVNMSENYISRLFKAETGINIIQYINLIKLEKAKELLLIKDNSIKQVSFMVGYDTPSYFNRLFNKLYGINPSDYIQMIDQLG